jgi:hypothetical protein
LTATVTTTVETDRPIPCATLVTMALDDFHKLPTEEAALVNPIREAMD